MATTDTTDISKMPTDGPAVNAPASGTYGEGAALERLRQSFPVAPAGGGGQGPQPVPPMQQPPTGAGVSNAPTGLPPGLLLPTNQPNVPASTPLAAPQPNPVAAAQTMRQKRLAVLDSIVASPTVSEATREWATHLRDLLIESSRG